MLYCVYINYLDNFEIVRMVKILCSAALLYSFKIDGRITRFNILSNTLCFAFLLTVTGLLYSMYACQISRPHHQHLAPSPCHRQIAPNKSLTILSAPLKLVMLPATFLYP